MTRSDRAMNLFAVFEGNRIQRDLSFAQYFQSISLKEPIGVKIALIFFEFHLT
jgi:hypothetical protein